MAKLTSESVEEARPPAGSRAVERAGHVLLCLGDAGGELGLSDIARSVGLGKSTTHRILQSLATVGLVMSSHERQTYRLGGRALQLGLVVLEGLPIRQEARPTLDELREITGESVALLIRVGHWQLAIDRAITHQQPKRFISVGAPLPLCIGAGGKALLAYESDDFLNQYLASDPKEIQGLTHEAISEELRQVREREYCLTHTPSPSVPTNALAMPVLNATGQLLAAVAISGPPERWSETRIRSQIERCRTPVQVLQDRVRYMEPTIFNA